MTITVTTGGGYSPATPAPSCRLPSTQGSKKGGPGHRQPCVSTASQRRYVALLACGHTRVLCCACKRPCPHTRRPAGGAVVLQCAPAPHPQRPAACGPTQPAEASVTRLRTPLLALCRRLAGGAVVLQCAPAPHPQRPHHITPIPHAHPHGGWCCGAAARGWRCALRSRDAAAALPCTGLGRGKGGRGGGWGVCVWGGGAAVTVGLYVASSGATTAYAPAAWGAIIAQHGSRRCAPYDP